MLSVNKDNEDEVFTPSDCRSQLLKHGYKANGVDLETEDNVSAALLKLLTNSTTPPQPPNDQDLDPLSGLQCIGETSPLFWDELRTRVPQMVFRKPIGGPITKAFETTFKVISTEADRLENLEAQVEDTSKQVYELEEVKGKEVTEKLDLFERNQLDEMSQSRLKLLDMQSEISTLAAQQANQLNELGKQVEDNKVSLTDMVERVVKERRRNIQERFAMALVMSRLIELKRSLDQNTEGDRELRESVELMQRQMDSALGEGEYSDDSDDDMPTAVSKMGEKNSAALVNTHHFYTIVTYFYMFFLLLCSEVCNNNGYVLIFSLVFIS